MPAAPGTHSQWVVGPGSPPRGRAVGGGRAPDPGRPTPRQEAPPRGTLKLPPEHARARAVALVTGPHARNPPHPQPVGSGPRQPAQRAGSWGRESARPQTPHTQARGAPPGHSHAAPTARKASSQERALWAWGRVPTPAPPRTHSQCVVCPGSPPRGRAVGDGRAPDPGHPTPRQEAPPPGRPRAAPTARKASPQERALWGWGRVPTPAPPRTHSQWVVGPGSPPEGRAVGGGRAPHPGRLTPRQEAPLPGTLNSPPQHARARDVGLVTGPHASTPPPPQQVGSGPRQPAQRAGARGWESA